MRNSSAATTEQLRLNKGKMESLDELVRQTLAEAQRDADHTRKDIRSAAEQESVLSRQRAEAEISRVQNQSLSDLFAAAAERVAEQAEAQDSEGPHPSRAAAADGCGGGRVCVAEGVASCQLSVFRPERSSLRPLVFASERRW